MFPIVSSGGMCVSEGTSRHEQKVGRSGGVYLLFGDSDVAKDRPTQGRWGMKTALEL